MHINSAIWNNALWSIRTQLAKVDNLPGNESPLAQAWDRAVYGALTTRLGPTTLAGAATIVLDTRGRVIRHDPSGAGRVLSEGPWEGVTSRGLSGGESGAAWAPTPDSLMFVDAEGNVSTANIPDLAGDEIMSVSAGGGAVSAGTRGGKVYRWRPGGAVERVGDLPGMVATIASYGDNVIAVHCTQEVPGKSAPKCSATVLTADGRSLGASANATVFGAAMSGEYAVWAEGKGPMTAGVTAGRPIVWPETDLRLLSLRSGKLYDIVDSRGQQGFPSISGRRLVWQDAALGGDDLMTALLPEGL